MSTYPISPASAPTRVNRRACMHAAWLCVIGAWLYAATPDVAAQAYADPADPAPTSMPREQAPAPKLTRQQIGDATSALLDMQVSGSAAAPALPMLGAAASLSWRRYLDSFTHPIPVTSAYTVREASSGK